MLNLQFSPSHIVCCYNERRSWLGYRQNAWLGVDRDRVSQARAIESHYFWEYTLGIVSILIWRHA